MMEFQSLAEIASLAAQLPEADEAVYNPATTYAAKALVLWKHSVYESQGADNTGNQPDLKPDKWTRVRASNQWRLFDGTNTSRTELPGIVQRYLDGEFALNDFITHTMGLDEINEAFDLMHEGKSIRSVIHFNK